MLCGVTRSQKFISITYRSTLIVATWATAALAEALRYVPSTNPSDAVHARQGNQPPNLRPSEASFLQGTSWPELPRKDLRCGPR